MVRSAANLSIVPQRAFALGLVSLFALLNSLLAQEGEQLRPVLVGLQDELGTRIAYALDRKIVVDAVNAKSSLISRAFVLATTKKDCCRPVKVSSHVWRCCDGTYVTTNDSTYAQLVSQVADTTEQAWAAASANNFNDLKGWAPLARAIEEHPPTRVPPSDQLFNELSWKEVPMLLK